MTTLLSAPHTASKDPSDGVVVLASLWRLLAQHKPWSNDLRQHWDGFVAGEYDWAPLSRSLWPKRLVAKCSDDRSLAIAHGLDDVLWVQGDDKPDKLHHHQSPTVLVAQLITERTHPASKVALGGGSQ